ncbi:hypothetical protein J7I98_29065 [Streptomyces sp. ISL-98]|uniref:DUF6177 family protein n=1 Tax=Streptomyces sp. ISL-98 TaxID=2819192 RepID=UPI001BE6EB45|nr:DUF6177 family protein [Streptomyces sp. ISL-98]MBT2509846.1 hypothetical protein [Streptomyces sp. ISL-98]
MTNDVIALTPKMPDLWTVVAGLHAGGPDLGVATTADGAVIQLCGPGGRPLVSIEAPILVHTPGEAERLLGTVAAGAPTAPLWWTEARASTAVPEAERLAGSFAGRLTTVLGGVTWPPEAAHTAVVPLSPDVTALPADADALPAVDVLTGSTAVVLSERPLVAMTAWLSDILSVCTETDRALHIVTPPHARLTLATRTALTGAPNRWVVQDKECGYYDGLSGAVLRWQDGTFAPVCTDAGATAVASSFARDAETDERQLILSFSTRHAPDEQLVLGRALEAAWQTLTGCSPVGWSTAEPINLPWSTRQLTDFARHRAPKPTWLLAIGSPDRPAIATMRVTRTKDGVEEEVTLVTGYGPDEEPPLHVVQPLAETLATRHGLSSMIASLRAARRDLTVPPRLETPPIPIAFTLGPDSVSDIGLGHARRPPLNLRPVQLGPDSRPGLHYPLGNGTDAESWTVLQELTRHLRTP